VATTVLGLKLGADDCVTKPFELSELLARVEDLLRRGALRTGGILRIGALRLDIPSRSVALEGRPVSLTTRESQLLHFLVQRARTPVARQELLRELSTLREWFCSGESRIRMDTGSSATSERSEARNQMKTYIVVRCSIPSFHVRPVIVRHESIFSRECLLCHSHDSMPRGAWALPGCVDARE
jgi:hypothetical protein